jgi:hypothetical protein
LGHFSPAFFGQFKSALTTSLLTLMLVSSIITSVIRAFAIL